MNYNNQTRVPVFAKINKNIVKFLFSRITFLIEQIQTLF